MTSEKLGDMTARFERNLSEQKRNRIAWEQFADPETDQCRYCPHDRYDHFGRSREAEGDDESFGEMSGAPTVVMTRLFCHACADELETHQVACYRRSAGDE